MGLCARAPKEVVPLFDDGPTCPYSIKPSDLFAMNEAKDMDKMRQMGGVSGLARAIRSHEHDGLDPDATPGAPESVQEHTRVFGPNRYKEVPPKNFFALCWENIQDPIILILIVAALASTVLGSALPEQRHEGEWIEGVAIWVAVLIVVAVGAGNDYQKDMQFRKLNAAKDIIEIKVVRGGQVKLIPNTAVVVGDLMVVDMGDKIIADGVMVDGHHLVVDEASLTGESDPIKKSPEEDPWCRSGTQARCCTRALGRLLVVAVGEQSEWGKTMALVGEAGGEDTPLQEKLGDMAAGIGKARVGLGVAVASFVALVITWFVTHCNALRNHLNQGGLVEFFLYAITIVVVAVPEGLPLAVTISLAYSMKKMMRDNNFVRVLAACETMGGATAICSDKTGTLTENRMTVTEGWFAGAKFDHAPAKEELRPELAEDLALNCALNSKAHVIDSGAGPATFVGNRTECALLMMAKRWGVDYAKMRDEWEPNVQEMYGFTSARKMASVLVRKEGRLRLYNKGAAEWVLQRCTRMADAAGGVRRRLPHCSLPPLPRPPEPPPQVVIGMASRGLRCICLAYTDYDAVDPSRAADYFADPDRADRDLVALAIVGIKDPVRREVPDAVKVCQKAGIVVRMVTGDNIHTARHIARECGILTDTGVALEGPAFRTMPAHELIPLLPRLQVLARSSPEDKLTLVSLLKKEGEVVAVTGDGTNDAPALKESDVGLAMGIAGTEVAKEAADIVIMDDNFSSIVKSVLWGRSVFSSIRKFLQFQLTVNFVSLVVAFVGAVAGGRIPLNVLQLLWVNLIMDTMGALALATEDPNPDLLNDKPHGREEPLITTKMWKHILVQGCYQLFWLFFFMYALPTLGWRRYWLTSGRPPPPPAPAPPCAPARPQVFNEINARRINDELNVFEGLHKSPIFMAVIAITIGLQARRRRRAAPRRATPMGIFFKVTPLNSAEWGISIAIGATAVPVSLLTRLLVGLVPAVRRRPRLRARTLSVGHGSRIHNEAVVAAFAKRTSMQRERTSAGGAAPGGGHPVRAVATVGGGAGWGE
ncbi:MAG: plasma membrane calcium ATPase [Monoraphidium minutum]|nr:MAG: plasma membrane calcium ATPase [Monoraphidium minutum]